MILAGIAMGDDWNEVAADAGAICELFGKILRGARGFSDE